MFSILQCSAISDSTTRDTLTTTNSLYILKNCGSLTFGRKFPTIQYEFNLNKPSFHIPNRYRLPPESDVIGVSPWLAHLLALPEPTIGGKWVVRWQSKRGGRAGTLIRAVKQHSIYKFKLTTDPYNYYLYNQSMSRKQTQPRRQKDDTPSEDRLHDVDAHKQRVTQTNMVYLIGLPVELADENLLAREEYCGQYGAIKKLLVKENHFNEFRSYCAYVTYLQEDAAALAVLGLNNFVFEGSRIYASYGTNKYCSAFVRFGKCKKAECPFLHSIDRQKEIRQEDNRKLFQEQQQLARRFVAANQRSIDFSSPSGVVFPTKAQVRQQLLDDGSIKPQEYKPPCEPVTTPRPCEPVATPRPSSLQKTLRSEASTECSPGRDSHQLEVVEQLPSIAKLIMRKVTRSKNSLFSFGRGGSAGEAGEVTHLLRSYFLTSHC